MTTVQRRRLSALTGERGAALLTAMIIVTLVASLAAGMVWQQYRAVQTEAADRARAQSGWILVGALDWARRILLEDAKGDQEKPPATDHLGEVWAVPLAESRLSTFLAADRTVGADDGPEAFLSGSIVDLQSRYNLRAVLGGDKVAPVERQTLERLCQSAQLPSSLASVIIDRLRGSFGSAPREAADGKPGSPAVPPDGSVQPINLSQLTWLGIPADAVERLRPFVVLLPRPTAVNLNTAPREVVAAVIDKASLADAERIVQERSRTRLRTLEQAKRLLPPDTDLSPDRVGVASSFFEVTGRLRLEERLLEQRSIIERRGLEMRVIARYRASQLLDQPLGGRY
jgi:general secretion pathway protein K